jgi:hypothetical protein
MKAYKITLLVIDHDGCGSDDIKEIIESAHYPNHCISPKVKEIEEKDIGVWTDDHPLNKHNTSDAEYYRLFDKTVTEQVYEEALDRVNQLEYEIFAYRSKNED